MLLAVGFLSLAGVFLLLAVAFLLLVVLASAEMLIGLVSLL